MLTSLPARDLVERLADAPALGPVALGHSRLSASVAELTEERFMRDVVTCAWATHLEVDGTPEANAAICLAALSDILGRLLDVAGAIRGCTGADWLVDPNGVALGYEPPAAPVAAVCLLPRDVHLAVRTPDNRSEERDVTRRSIWPALDPLIRAWCEDADLDPEQVSRPFGRPTPTIACLGTSPLRPAPAR